MSEGAALNLPQHACTYRVHTGEYDGFLIQTAHLAYFVTGCTQTWQIMEARSVKCRISDQERNRRLLMRVVVPKCQDACTRCHRDRDVLNQVAPGPPVSERRERNMGERVVSINN